MLAKSQANWASLDGHEMDRLLRAGYPFGECWRGAAFLSERREWMPGGRKGELYLPVNDFVRKEAYTWGLAGDWTLRVNYLKKRPVSKTVPSYGKKDDISVMIVWPKELDPYTTKGELGVTIVGTKPPEPPVPPGPAPWPKGAGPGGFMAGFAPQGTPALIEGTRGRPITGPVSGAVIPAVVHTPPGRPFRTEGTRGRPTEGPGGGAMIQAAAPPRPIEAVVAGRGETGAVISTRQPEPPPLWPEPPAPPGPVPWQQGAGAGVLMTAFTPGAPRAAGFTGTPIPIPSGGSVIPAVVEKEIRIESSRRSDQ